MNAKSLLALALLSAAVSAAFAQERVPDGSSSTFTSTQTRAEVRAALEQARRDGTLHAAHSENYMPMVRSIATRDEVRAALRMSRQSGEYDAINAPEGVMASAPAVHRTATVAALR